MAARLVKLEVQLRRIEDDREPARRALGRGQKRHGLVGERLGTTGEAEAADELVAGRLPAAAGVGIAPALVLVALDGVGFDRRADVGDDLSVRLPSVAANVFHSRCAAYIDSVKAMPLTPAAALRRRQAGRRYWFPAGP